MTASSTNVIQIVVSFGAGKISTNPVAATASVVKRKSKEELSGQPLNFYTYALSFRQPPDHRLDAGL